jgi:hypothetical protein
VSGAVRALLDRMPVRSAEEPPDAVPEAVAVVPGTLGSWSPDADDGEGAP